MQNTGLIDTKVSIIAVKRLICAFSEALYLETLGSLLTILDDLRDIIIPLVPHIVIFAVKPELSLGNDY